MTCGALYMHVPFCVRKCAYCDFASWATEAGDPLMGAYTDALALEIRELLEAGLLGDVRTAYVGGGTPTLLGTRLAGLVADVREACPCAGELTFEANPDSLTGDVLAGCVAAGATRVSIGVQSLDDAELAALGRIHSAEQALGAVGRAMASGLDVSCDLMCAIPGQTDASWARTLAGVVDAGVGHVSVYPLQLEEGTPLGERWAEEEPAFNDPDVQAARMERAASALEGAGYARYEVASYALPGRECRHNEAYWTGVPYLGLGCGAASMVDRAGYEQLRANVCPQLPTLDAGVARVRLVVEGDRQEVADAPLLGERHFSLDLLSEREAVAEDLMLGMRMTSGVGEDLLVRARDVIGAERVDATVEGVVKRGLAAWSGEGRLVPTSRGWLLGNELYAELWALAEKQS